MYVIAYIYDVLVRLLLFFCVWIFRCTMVCLCHTLFLIQSRPNEQMKRNNRKWCFVKSRLTIFYIIKLCVEACTLICTRYLRSIIRSILSFCVVCYLFELLLSSCICCSCSSSSTELFHTVCDFWTWFVYDNLILFTIKTDDIRWMHWCGFGH